MGAGCVGLVSKSPDDPRLEGLEGVCQMFRLRLRAEESLGEGMAKCCARALALPQADLLSWNPFGDGRAKAHSRQKP